MHLRISVFALVAFCFLVESINLHGEDSVIYPPPLPPFKVPKESPFEQNSTLPLDEVFHASDAPEQGPQTNFAYQEWIPTQSLHHDEDDLIINVKWKLDAKAAVFKRGNIIWVFFDRPALFKLEHLPIPVENLVTSVTQLNEKSYSVLRFDVSEGVDVAVEQEGSHWKLHFNLTPSAPNPLLPLNPPLLKTSEKSITYSLKDPGVGILFRDPIVGDELFILPTPLAGVYKPQETPAYKILPSKVGFVVQKKSAGLTFEQSASHIHLTHAGENTFSSYEDRESKRTLAHPNRFFVFHDVSGDPKDFHEKSRKLLTKIVEAPPEKLPELHLALAKHFLSYGFAEEALGALRRISYDVSCTIQPQEVRALVGISQGLIGRTQEAILTFEDADIAHDPEVKLWLGVFYMMNRDYEAGYEDVLAGLRYLEKYPSALRNFICFQAAYAAHMIDKPGQQFLDLIDPLILTNKEKELFQVYKAFFLQRDKKFQEAEDILRQSLRSPNERARIEALLALTNMDSLDESGKKAEIKNLENIRLDWRGDETELKILKRLVSLYDEFREYPKALGLLRQIITYFPNTSEKRWALQKAESIVSKRLEEKDLTPVKTIAFYQDYSDLFPKDDARFKSIGQIVDAYFDLNLLEEAGRILRDELNSPPQDSEDYARFLLRLSYIFIETGKINLAQKALERIDRLRLANLEVTRQRNFLEAKIMTMQENPTGALTLLQDDPSLESLELQAEISWELKDWKKVIGVLQKIKAFKEKERKLTPDVILNLAVAYFHDKNVPVLLELKEQYGSFMERSLLSHTFAILTDTTKEVAADRQSFLDQLNQVGAFKDHLKHFREKMAKDLKPA